MIELLNAIGPWIVGAVLFGFPIWLAWWLSDGFTEWDHISPSSISYEPRCDPHTGKYQVVPVDAETGIPIVSPHTY